MRWSLLLVAVLAAFGIGLFFGGGESPSEESHAAAPPQEKAASVWTCSMHPQIKLPKAGQCPICFMDLIPLENDSDEDLGPTTLVLSERAAALAEIQTTPVVRRHAATSVRLTGKVDYDETSNRTIAAWVPGRIDTLFVDFTGTEVSTGDPLVSVYSPDLYAAQVELLNAVTAESELKNSSDQFILSTARSTVEAGKERLRLWGLNDNQIESIVNLGKAKHHVRINAPVGGVVVHKNAIEGRYVQTGSPIYTLADLSKIWVILDAFESDLPWLKLGQSIDFTVQAVPGQSFSGNIIFIDPILDPRTRTVKIRLEVENPDRLLKPGMFVSAFAKAGNMDSGPQDGDQNDMTAPLLIPSTAPLITGKRAVVYVRLQGQEKPTFEGRVITLGPKAGDFFIVKEGLQEGELVVTKGNFKLDSALQIQAKPSMMNPEGGGPTPGHNHGQETSGNSPADQAESIPDSKLEVYSAPIAFNEQLAGVLEAYLELTTALAADNDPDAQGAAENLKAAIKAVDMALLEGEAHTAWMDDRSHLEGIAGKVISANDIATRRDQLLSLTPAVWNTLRRFSYSSPDPVRLFNCPMANNNKGGDWLQLEPDTANPYFGSSMLRCGSQIDSLLTATNHEGH